MKKQRMPLPHKVIPSSILIVICVIFVGMMYVHSRPAPMRLLYQSHGLRDMGKESQWFKAESEGLACTTWFTCKGKGAKIREIYIEQRGTVFPLGKVVGGYSFVDMHGKSPVGTDMESCIGNDEGISFELKKSESESRYKKGDDVLVLVTVRTNELRRNMQYEYVLPGNMIRLDEAYKAAIVYDASLGDEIQTYIQHAHARSCMVQ